MCLMDVTSSLPSPHYTPLTLNNQQDLINALHKEINCLQWNFMTAKSGDGIKFLKSARGNCPFSVSFSPFISFSWLPWIFYHKSVILPGLQSPLHSMPWLQGLLGASSLLSLCLLVSAPNCIFPIFMFLQLTLLWFQSDFCKSSK